MSVYTPRTRFIRSPASAAPPVLAPAIEAVAVVRFVGDDVIVDLAGSSRQTRPDADHALAEVLVALQPGRLAQRYAVLFAAGESRAVALTRRSGVLAGLFEQMRSHDQVEMRGEAVRLRRLGLL